jgi:hypothetical protein
MIRGVAGVGGGGREGRVVRLTRQQNRSFNEFGGKINILIETFDFLRSTNFKLLSQI